MVVVLAMVPIALHRVSEYMFGAGFSDSQPARSRVLSSTTLFVHVQKQKRRLTIIPRPSLLLYLADSDE